MDNRDPKDIVAEVCAKHGIDPAELLKRGSKGTPLRTPKLAACRRECAVTLYSTGRFGQLTVGKLVGLSSCYSLQPMLAKVRKEKNLPTLWNRGGNGMPATAVDLDAMTYLLDSVAARRSVDPAKMTSRLKHSELVAARAEFCYRCRTELGATYDTIGAFLGMHHSTVAYMAGRHAYAGDARGDAGLGRDAIMKVARSLRFKPDRPTEPATPVKRRTLAEWKEQCRQKAIAAREVLAARAEKRKPTTDTRPYTLEEIGAYYGVSRETASNWIDDIQDKLIAGFLADPYIREWVRENT